ncbi:hypothetical protein [Phycisphaera mikurensis]|uniref:hypothetical protein n=1 Tax=Phycisphaera mikurensis TaxID=547188 RepID=UPI00059E9E1F|nr:hypothetical protein [Phycisphaera mikurensis]MBB6442795.1 hypothetical protein [Phycisphaera mikurensis]
MFWDIPIPDWKRTLVEMVRVAELGHPRAEVHACEIDGYDVWMREDEFYSEEEPLAMMPRSDVRTSDAPPLRGSRLMYIDFIGQAERRLRLAELVESLQARIPEEISGGVFPPWDPFVKIGRHTVWQRLGEQPNGTFGPLLHGRPTLSLSISGDNGPKRQDEYRKLVLSDPVLAALRGDLEVKFGPSQVVMFWD